MVNEHSTSTAASNSLTLKGLPQPTKLIEHRDKRSLTLLPFRSKSYRCSTSQVRCQRDNNWSHPLTDKEHLMSRLIGPIRLRLLILTSIILVTAYTAMPQRGASACIECVDLTGGLCVGCDSNATKGHNFCWPDQQCCCCQVRGECGSPQ